MLQIMLSRRIYYLKFIKNLGVRTFLSEAYSCENAWQKRLSKPPLKGLKMDQYFIEVDKKFQTKRLASGVDIDMFANSVTDESQLEELEHLLYRFRRTKRATEMMDSTHHAVVKAFLQFKDYDSLFRILGDREDYGVFPDHYAYNLLMDTFLKEERFRDAADVAVLMMLQEDFSNSISRVLALYSCYQFLNKGLLDTFWQRSKEEEEEVVETKNEAKKDDDEDDDEEVYVRIPYLRNPWFDDHFDIRDPKQLIGKTLYLVGCQEDHILGRTSQVLGLSMWGKWEKALKVLENMSKSTLSPLLLEEGVSKVRENVAGIPDDNEDKNTFVQTFENIFSSLQQDNKISPGDLINECEKEVKRISTDEKTDIKAQHELYSAWERSRQEALQEQEKDVDKEKRLKIISEIKEELYWKEKKLFFFENKEDILDELDKVNKVINEQKAQLSVEDTYVPPEITKKKRLKISQLRKKAMVKKI